MIRVFLFMKKLTTVPIKVIKEYVIKGWNSSSHIILNLYPKSRKAALGALLASAANEVKKEKKYNFEPSYLSYHSDELLRTVEKLINASSRVNT